VSSRGSNSVTTGPPALSSFAGADAWFVTTELTCRWLVSRPTLQLGGQPSIESCQTRGSSTALRPDENGT
jgi:hypothetical protein